MMMPRTDRPRGYGSMWPDYVQEAWDVYGRHAVIKNRMRPSIGMLNDLDLVLDWIPLLSEVHYRKVLGYRMLIWPDTDRYVYSWRKIGDKMHRHHQTVKNWHEEGLVKLARKLNIN